MKPTLRSSWFYYLLLLPSLLLSMTVILGPALMTVYTSFTDWNGISSNMNFIGIQNYKELFADKVFRHSLANNFKWMVLFLIVPVSIGLTAASFLMKRKRSRSFYQVTFLLPYVIAPIANAILWLNIIYSPLTGLIGFLKKSGFSSLSSPLSNTSTALFGVAAVDIWHYWGFLAVIYLAALRQTSADQIEAAVVEGAGSWQVFRYIYFPNILPTFRLLMIMIIIQSFLTFDYVYLLTAGGPARATEMLSTMSYNFAFYLFQFGKASAVAMIMSVFGFVASVFYLKLSRTEEQQ